jgi:hypothetical protein
MINIAIEYHQHFIVCRVSGDNTAENVIRYLNEVHDAMEHHRCTKVMVVENLAGRGLGLLQMYTIIRTAKKTILSRPHAIAYIDENPAHELRSMKFAETAALNRFINMRVFTNERQATAWLESVAI